MTPNWVRNAIFYQIFPDRFYDGDHATDPPGSRPWGERPTRESFFGGDLVGITEKLDYLENLGITALYLTPIFTAPSNHKYDTVDYFEVDPAFGGNAALARLVTALHDRGMRIILDGVFNHCSDRHPFFLDVIAHGKASEYWDWFTIEGAEVISEPEPNYARWAGVRNMPEWNHRNRKVREYLLSVVRHWIHEYDIDGWRLDTTDYLPPDFVKDIRCVAKEEKSDAYIVGEVMGLATSWFKHDALDGVMHYRLRDALIGFFANGDCNAASFAGFVRSIWHSYPDEANYSSYTLLGSHDKPRFLTLCGGDKTSLILAAAFLFTFPGAAAIYYGDEIGLEGGDDPDCRRVFPWNEKAWDRNLLETFHQLAHLRQQEACLRRGTIEFVTAHEQHLVFKRKLSQEEIIIAINTGNKDEPLNLASPGNWVDLFAQVPVPSTTAIPRRGFRIVKRA
jgi:glycosidase